MSHLDLTRNHNTVDRRVYFGIVQILCRSHTVGTSLVVGSFRHFIVLGRSLELIIAYKLLVVKFLVTLIVSLIVFVGKTGRFHVGVGTLQVALKQGLLNLSQKLALGHH